MGRGVVGCEKRISNEGCLQSKPPWSKTLRDAVYYNIKLGK